MNTPAAPVPMKRRHRRKISRDEFRRLYTEKCIDKTHIDAAAAIGISPGTYNKYLRDLEASSPEAVKLRPVGAPRIFSAEEFKAAYNERQLFKLPHYKAAVVMGISPSSYERYVREMCAAGLAN